MASTRILVIGSTGKIGRHLAKASLNAGHPTALLVRPATAGAGADPVKAKLLNALCNNGARLVYGDVNDHESLVAAVKHADVVISAVGHTSPEELVESQLKIMGAIQDAGNVKRFVPCEYGCNVEVADRILEPARSILGAKLRIRQALRASGIPHTIICSYLTHGLLPKAGNPEAGGPPITRVTIFGDGKQQDRPVMFVDENDMSTVTIKAVDDPRTLNKTKIGRNLEKCYVSEEELARKIQASPYPLNFQLAIVHWTLLAGVLSCGQITFGFGVEATELYPDMKYVTVEEYIGDLIG